MRIGVFCSGGDAPGMNACVRAVVRTALAQGHEVIGIRRGYQGLLEEDFFLNRGYQGLPETGLSLNRGDQGLPEKGNFPNPQRGQSMTLRSVSDWERHGGTYLRSSRSEQFRSVEGQQRAAEVLNRHGIEALIPIGGDGTFRGAVALAKCWRGGIVGCPGTIDNDLLGSDFTIGFSTAVDTAVEAVDKIRDTAESHERMFLIEVMGRHSGYIAAYTALASGAETVCIPETDTDIDTIVAQLHELKRRGKSSVMMVVAEGDERGGAFALQQQLQQSACPFATRVVVLGHLQRGGSPTPEDRILGTQLGSWAVDAVLAGESGVMSGRVGGQRQLTPLRDTFAHHKPISSEVLDLLVTMAH